MIEILIKYLYQSMFNNTSGYPQLRAGFGYLYIGTVAVGLPPTTTKNLSIPTIISSSHRLIICTLSVDVLAVTFT